jgi:hypothetical protein
MDDGAVTTNCPNCACRRDVVPSLSHTEVECRACGWEFAVDDEGRVTDDGGLDPEGPFEIDEEGDLTAETLSPVACPTCARRFEVGEPGVARCPGCHHRFAVGEGFGAPGQRHVVSWKDWEEEERDVIYCPFCLATDEEGPSLLPLDRGWVFCPDCHGEFFSQPVFEELMNGNWRGARPPGRGRVPRYVVAADGSGDYRDLYEAINAVSYDGDGRGRIVVRAGEYRTNRSSPHNPLTVDGLTLETEGPAEQVRLADALRLLGGRVRLRGLSLEEPLYAEHTRLTLEHCTLSGRAAVEASGSRCKVRLGGCRIEEAGDGVRAERGATLRLTRCTFQGNAGDAVRLRDGAWARLRRCDITSNRGDGVRAGWQDAVFLHGCHITDNEGRGVALDGGRAVLTNCTIAGQEGTGLVVGARGRVLLRGCDVRGGRSDGVCLGRRARALLVGCVLGGNGGAGAVVGPRARAVLRRCRVEGNGAAGVRLAASGAVGWQASACGANRGGDWDVAPGGRVTTRPRSAQP